MKTLIAVLLLLVLASCQAASSPQSSPGRVSSPASETTSSRPTSPGTTSALASYNIPVTNPAGKARKLDVYRPMRGKNHPVIIWIHGGSWTKGDKSDVDRKPQAFTEKDFVFVSVNYGFTPKVTVADQAGDVARAIKYVHDNCSKWGGDRRTIFIMGHSAGAHLTALVSTDEKHLKAQGLGLSNIKGCVALDVAGYDIPTRSAKAGDSLKKTLAMIFGADKDSQAQVSPITHVAKNKNIPPFLVIHINLDPQKAQSEAFVKKLLANGVSARIHPAPNRGHKNLNEEIGKAGDVPTQEMFKFLDRLLGK
jgi:arylformamidase